jgi:hypothetical protein
MTAGQQDCKAVSATERSQAADTGELATRSPDAALRAWHLAIIAGVQRMATDEAYRREIAKDLS